MFRCSTYTLPPALITSSILPWNIISIVTGRCLTDVSHIVLKAYAVTNDSNIARYSVARSCVRIIETDRVLLAKRGFEVGFAAISFNVGECIFTV